MACRLSTTGALPYLASAVLLRRTLRSPRYVAASQAVPVLCHECICDLAAFEKGARGADLEPRC